MTNADLKKFIAANLAESKGTIENAASDLLEKIEAMINAQADKMIEKAEEACAAEIEEAGDDCDEEAIARKHRLA